MILIDVEAVLLQGLLCEASESPVAVAGDGQEVQIVVNSDPPPLG